MRVAQLLLPVPSLVNGPLSRGLGGSSCCVSPSPGESAPSAVLCVSRGPCPKDRLSVLGCARLRGQRGQGQVNSLPGSLAVSEGGVVEGKTGVLAALSGQSWGSGVVPCVDRALRHREALGPASLLAPADAVRVPVSLTAQTLQLSAVSGSISPGLGHSCVQVGRAFASSP